MITFIALLKREVGAYFVSPMAYIVLIGFLFICGMAFSAEVSATSQQQSPIRFDYTMLTIASVSILITPLVTMRLLAEERHKGTIELLMTSPITETQIVLAKFFAALIFYVYLLAPTVVYCIILSMKTSIDVGQIISSYLGLLLFAGALFSIGLFVSSMCANQVSAGILTLAIAFAIIMLDTFTTFYIKNPAIADVLKYINFIANLKPSLLGLLDLRCVTFFLSICIFFNFLSIKVLQIRRIA